MAGNSSERTFQTVELLENILTFLSLEDIIHMARINSFWKTVISNSRTLRQIRFLVAEPEGRVFKGESSIESIFDYENNMLTRLHPLLPKCLAPADGPPMSYMDTPEAHINHHDRPGVDVKQLVAMEGIADMLFSQPPPTNIKFRYSSSSSSNGNSEIVNRDGITIGMVQKELERILEEQTEDKERSTHSNIHLRCIRSGKEGEEIELLTPEDLADKQERAEYYASGKAGEVEWDSDDETEEDEDSDSDDGSEEDRGDDDEKEKGSDDISEQDEDSDASNESQAGENLTSEA